MRITERTKRLNILSAREIEELFGFPNFSNEEKKLYFTLNPDEQKVMLSFGSKLSRIFFILQLGYFKAKQNFFNIDLQTIQADFSYIAKTYFPHDTIAPSLIGQKARLNHQSHILAMQGYTRGSDQFQRLTDQALEIAKICVDPRYIFDKLLDFLDQNQVVVPSYSTLQDIIGKVLSTETKRLNQLIAKNLSPSVNQALQDMLHDEDQKMYGVTLLKRDAKGFNHAELTKEIHKHQSSIALFKAAKQLIPALGISEQNIRYYAYLVDYYTMNRLRELTSDTVKLYLLCYIYYRFEKINDNLIYGFLHHLNKYKSEARTYSKNAVFEYKVEAKGYSKQAGEILDFFTDEAIADSEAFGTVRRKAFHLVAREKFPALKAHVTQSFNEEGFRWDYYKAIAKTISYNLRPIVKVLDFSSDQLDCPLLQVLLFFQSIWNKKKSLKQVKGNEFPTACLPKDLEKYVYDTVNVEGIPQKILNVDAYEFMVYDQLAKAMDAGEIVVNDSFSFKGLKQDLLLDWSENQEEILAKLNNPVLNTPIKKQLQELKKELEPLVVKVNKNIAQGKNKEFKIKPNKNNPKQQTWTLTYLKKNDEINNPFYNQFPKVTLSQVLRFVDYNCHFTKAFTHVKPRFAKVTEFDTEALFAILIANATNYGIYHMAGICDIDYNTLFLTSKSLIRLETLKNSNHLLGEKMAELPIFKHWDLLEQQRIAAFDGKKIQTRIRHILARYSSKYFGQKRGVVSYSLNYNNLCANSTVIGANEHESHYSYSIAYNAEIDADWYCGDTHSINQVQHAFFHLISKKFTPHLKKIHDKANAIISFKNPNVYEKYVIKPTRQTNTKSIEAEWNNLQHIFASMLMGSSSHSVIVSKLSSHKRSNQTQEALWEYNKILQSIHTLKFIDDPLYRQAIRGALNRVEGYHQLTGKIGGVHGGKFRGTTENELMVWNECCSLVANIIMYYNALILSKIYQVLEKQGNTQALEFIKRLSPIAWCHLILDGFYQFRNVAETIDLEQMIVNLVFEDKNIKKSKT